MNRSNIYTLRTQTRPPNPQRRGWWQTEFAPQRSGEHVSKGAAELAIAMVLERALEINRSPASAPKTADLSPQRGPFANFGDFLRCVADARTGRDDRRLVRAPKGANETDPSLGGFLVPAQFAPNLIASMYAGSSIAPLCDVVELGGTFSTIKQPGIDETSRTDGSRFGGALAYMLSEADTVPPTKPRVRMMEWSAHKGAVFMPVTNELLRDAPPGVLLAYANQVMLEEGGFLLSKQIISGTGVGTALGIMNAPATIQVAKGAGQAAATITEDNVNAMWSRMPLTSRRNAVFLVCEDAEAQIEQFDAPLYMPAGAVGNEFPLLKGRPVIPVEQCPQLGQPGDIICADLSAYKIYQAPPKFALSVHFGFDTDESAFRFIVRFDGKPIYSSPVTPWNGSNVTRSPFVTLAAR